MNCQQPKKEEKIMKRIKFMMNTTLVLGILLLGCSLAQAGADRTWVSASGNDANPCSRTSPCQTFAAAYANTNVGGQINVIDAGGYGTLVITHSITIDGSESMASVLATKDTVGFIINTGASDVVVLRGLNIQGGGQNGIRFIGAGKLYVEDCRIFGFQQKGIDFMPNGDGELFVKDSIIRNNAAAGILVAPTASGSARATIDHTRLDGNQNGLSVLDESLVTIRNSITSNSNANGVVALGSAAGGPQVSVENCLIFNNVSIGVKSTGSKAIVLLSGSTVTGNDTGLSAAGGGDIHSFGNNNVEGNVSGNGVPSNTISQL
jgi:Right handed beta helix region